MNRPMTRRTLVGKGLGLSRATRPIAPAPDLEKHILSRATWGVTPDDLDEMRRMGWKSWIEWQLNPALIDDSVMENDLRSMITRPFTIEHAQADFLFRCLYSRRQLAMRMCWFLSNHFATAIQTTEAISVLKALEEFRTKAFASFREVLHSSAKSPAMIEYLDSVSNVAGRPNENYTREVMELHTVGVNGGYSEADIVEGARIFTGWSRRNTHDPITGIVTDSQFTFEPVLHDAGPKTMRDIGFSTPGYAGAQGVVEGEALLDFLASHPSTAEFFVGKLCRYFVADEPQPGLIARVKKTFQTSNGNLQATVRQLFTDPDFAHPSHFRAKTMDGAEYALNAVRRLGVRANFLVSLGERVQGMGLFLHNPTAPTGFPEASGSWQGAGNITTRWQFIEDLMQDRVVGLHVDWSAIAPAPLPTTSDAWVDWMLVRLVDGLVEERTVQVIKTYAHRRWQLLGANPTGSQIRAQLNDLAALVLRLPEANVN